MTPCELCGWRYEGVKWDRRQQLYLCALCREDETVWPGDDLPPGAGPRHKIR